jgi:hypothetical protein
MATLFRAPARSGRTGRNHDDGAGFDHFLLAVDVKPKLAFCHHRDLFVFVRVDGTRTPFSRKMRATVIRSP